MGMCAIRGPVVTSGGGADEEGDSLTPRSATSSSSSSDVSSSSQELGNVHGAAGFEAGAALWQRTIPRGRRCRPLSFSGLIVYDASGNQLDHCPRLPRDSREDREASELDD